MSQEINQEFQIEIIRCKEDGEPEVIAQNLSAQISSWEREFNDEDDDTDPSFLVNEDGASDDSDDGDDDDTDGDDADQDDGDPSTEFEIVDSDSTLSLVTTVNAGVLADIKALQELDADDHVKVRVVYGTEPVQLVREFMISPDVAVLLTSGDRVAMPKEALQITIVADVFDSATIF